MHSFIHRIDYGLPVVTTTQNKWKKLRESRILCYILFDSLIITEKEVQYARRMDRDRDRERRLIMKYQLRGKRNQGRPLKRLLDC